MPEVEKFELSEGRIFDKDEENGFLWESKSELINKTMNLINSPKRLHDISKRAQVDSVHFGYEKFREKVLELI